MRLKKYGWERFPSWLSNVDVLNLTFSELGTAVVRGRRVVLIFMPLALALGGRCVRKSRAGLAHGEKGLNLAVTSVMNFVIILADCDAQGALCRAKRR